MAIPFAIFYYIYLLFVFAFLVYTTLNLYHLVRFGLLTLPVIIVIFVYIAGASAIMLLSWGFISQIDWQQAIELMPPLPNYTNGL